LRAGRESAFERLVVEFGPRMRATALRILREEHEANDAVQDALLSACRSVSSFEGRCPLGAWLHQLAVNASLMKLRSSRARPEPSLGEGLPEFDETGHFRNSPAAFADLPVAELEREETVAAVRAAVGRLPDKFRLPLVLRDLEGLEYEQISAQMGISENAIKIRVHRARQALRSLLESRFSVC
jgi:RNA polymerase sigma-70 factor (ECF subfamily)